MKALAGIALIGMIVGPLLIFAAFAIPDSGTMGPGLFLLIGGLICHGLVKQDMAQKEKDTTAAQAKEQAANLARIADAAEQKSSPPSTEPPR